MAVRAISPGLRLLAFAGYAPVIFSFFNVKDYKTQSVIITSAFVSFLGFLATKALIPLLIPVHLRRNLFGLDINKRGNILYIQSEEFWNVLFFFSCQLCHAPIVLD